MTAQSDGSNMQWLDIHWWTGVDSNPFVLRIASFSIHGFSKAQSKKEILSNLDSYWYPLKIIQILWLWEMALSAGAVNQLDVR